VTKPAPKKKGPNKSAAKKTEVVETNGHAETAMDDIEMIDVSKPSNKNKSIEEIYQKKSQLEHILLRPDTYVGSTEVEEEEMWVFDSEQSIIKKKKIKYVPGLYKIVDEILVNAADHKVKNII
jgi:DNA topoisomerase-2